MKQKWMMILWLVMIISVFLISCTPNAEQCSVDSDCVPAQCCHPFSAVNKEYAPDCSEAFCPAVCEPGTLDCGQGEIKCLSNRCTAVINSQLS